MSEPSLRRPSERLPHLELIDTVELVDLRRIPDASTSSCSVPSPP